MGESEGFVVWLEGLPGAGKTTLSRRIATDLAALELAPEVLDGEEVRASLFPELGFSRKDRESQARRVSQLARMLARHGAPVLVAMITPYETSRQAARAAFGGRFVEIWLNCPLAVCRTRDPGGIYRRTDQGVLHKVTGMDDPFEEPLAPDLTIDTSKESVELSARRVVDHLRAIGWLPALAR